MRARHTGSVWPDPAGRAHAPKPEAAMDINACLEPGRVLCNVEARSKKHSLDILSELLAAGLEDVSHDEVFDSLIAREKVGSTALAGGVAIPHGCMADVDSVRCAFLKLSEPVDYDTADGRPVDLVCGLILPQDEADQCSQQLTEMAELFEDPELLQLLRAAASSRSLYDLLSQYPAARTASA
jgi:PTS system nitrogen regulatory IIA component